MRAAVKSRCLKNAFWAVPRCSLNFVHALIFVLPLIYKMSGDELKLNYIDAIASTVLKKRKGRAEFQRGISYIKNGKR